MISTTEAVTMVTRAGKSVARFWHDMPPPDDGWYERSEVQKWIDRQ